MVILLRCLDDPFANVFIKAKILEDNLATFGLNTV